MKILIYGAGAVGSVIGAFLARTGHDVSLLGREEHLSVIQKKGLKVTGIWGEYYLKAFRLFYDFSQIPKEENFDLIFLTVKSLDTESAVRNIARLIKEGTLISFQNGLGNIETLLKYVSLKKYLPGRVIFGAQVPEPGVVEVTVSADDILVGALPGGAGGSPSAQDIAGLLSSAKLSTRVSQDIVSDIWSKVIYNCALNGICTLKEIPYGKILEDEELKKEMQAIVKECYEVAKSVGVKLLPESAEAYLDVLQNKLIPKTAAHYPSMLQDVRKGREIEMDALNGAIVRLGLAGQISTPANQKITQSVIHKSLATKKLKSA